MGPGRGFRRKRDETDQIDAVGEHALALGAPELQVAVVVGADVGVGTCGGKCKDQGRGQQRRAVRWHRYKEKGGKRSS